MSHSTILDSNNALVQNAPPLPPVKTTSPMPLDRPSVSPPPAASKISPTRLPESGNNDALDAENDSEAETLIVSPVKKRDLLKQSNSAQALESIDEIPEKTAVQPDEEHSETAREASEDKAQTNGDDLQKQEDQSVAEDVKPDEKSTHANGDNQDSDSDNLSEVSSVESFEVENGHGNDVKNNENDDDDDDEDGRSWASDKDDQERSSNPRKRKHTDVDQPRRKRRSSQDDGEHSSSPQLRRHRRTASAQSARPSQSRSNSGQHLHTAGVARQRRAATHIPVRETMLARNVWDSDTSSETSHQYPKSRLTRNTSRAVSTPGRPMGLAKRHVNKYGFTRLAEACENGDLDGVKEWRAKDPEQLEQREFAGNTPLQVASLNGYPEIVSYLLEQGCNPHCANADKDTPLIDAVENGHLDVVQILLKAGINPLHCNLKGQQALDVITKETDNATEIRAALREAIEDWNKNGRSEQTYNVEEPASRPGPKQGLQFLARTYENLLKLVSENDRTAVQEFLDARVPVDNNVVAAAAKTGDLYLVNMLLAEMTPKKARQRADRPMLSVIGTSHFEMVKALTELDQFEPRWRSKSSNLTWFEIAESKQGPRWREEKALLEKLYEKADSAHKLSSSPVARREPTKKRRRSAERHNDSDVEMEDADSPERARSRRRLVSKKDMRTASRQRSSSELSDVAPPRRHGERLSDQNLKPPGPRKVGRPRKHSNSHLSEPQPKRQRSSSMIEPAEEDHTPYDSEDDAQHEDDEDIKMEEPDREAAEAEATRKADLDAKADAQKLADKLRKDEQTRKEEEAARRKEAERKAEEIRQQHERKLAEDRRLDRERKVQALPSALSHVLGLVDVHGKERQAYIQRHFLPVQVVRRADLGDVGEEGKPDDLWMLSYQAAAILTGKDANILLDLPIDAKTKPSLLSGSTTSEVTEEQRRLMLACLQSTSLVHGLSSNEDSETEGPGNLLAELAEAERIQHRIKEDRAKFLSMGSLRWMRFSDFYKIATSAECPHLDGLDLQMRFDCCLDPFPFSSDIKTVNGTNDNDKERVNGTNGTDQRGLSAAGPGVTTITVVQD
ncbi:ankyrin [Aureobasidium pullulans]|uniref:Ankyrin n=1 Tax=Aureobasidium pullulans TaxID=5580 RepID=A0A4T0B6Z0_AURPU|nr:ankyrin [Aureobasidium pullulans]